MTEKTIIEQIQDTQTLLETLSAEQTDLGAKMAISADDADSASLISLARRRDELPVEILSSQIILERLLLRRDEERLPLLQNEVAELAKPIEPMLKKIAEMQREFSIASGAVSTATEDVRETKMSISERRRAIESLFSQARNVKVVPASLQAHGR